MPMQKNLEEKVQQYLEARGMNFQHNSIKYIGIMSDFPVSDNETKDVHVIRFALESGLTDEVMICYIYANNETERLEYLITPHFGETIIE